VNPMRDYVDPDRVHQVVVQVHSRTMGVAVHLEISTLHVQLYKVQQLRAAARSQWSEFC
jgi:hypothetical protein